MPPRPPRTEAEDEQSTAAPKADGKTDADAPKAETLHYTGKVKETAPASRSWGPRWLSDGRSSRGTTRTGSSRSPRTPRTPTALYSFTIPPEQVAEGSLYIELDVEHPDYATRARFGYSLAMIRKNEKLGERPFFENIELRPGKAILGRRAARRVAGQGRVDPGVFRTDK